jgi:hypothetical protein
VWRRRKSKRCDSKNFVVHPDIAARHIAGGSVHDVIGNDSIAVKTINNPVSTQK